jgi:type 1 glutamine amidotransferase
MDRALISWGGWDGHKPGECAEIAATILKDAGFDVSLENNLDCFLDRGKLAELSLIVPMWTMSTISGDQAKGLLGAVRDGVGIAGFHGGMADSFRAAPGYQFMVGGQWVAHPGDTVDYEVTITKKEDPITYGLSDFEMHSEQYYMHVDPGNEVLATTIFEKREKWEWITGTLMPVAWKRHYGKGSVFYCSLGHEPKDFDKVEVREIIRRGMLWAAQ